MKLLASATAIIAFCSVPAVAMSATPTPSPSPAPVIATVRVATGSSQSLHELPVAASVLDATRIANTSSLTGDALFRNLPGFDRNRSNSSFTNYGQMRVSFTGAGNDRGLVLADGIPAQDAFGGQIDWAAYPAGDITRAELLRGGGSALYGAGAIGGVLAIDTVEPSSSPRNGSVTFAAGTPGALRNYARIGLPLSSKLQSSFSAQQTQLTYDDLPPAYAAPSDQPAQSQTSMASLRLRFTPSATTTLEYGYRGAWDYQQEGRANYDFWRRLHQHAVTYGRTSSHASFSAQAYARVALVTNSADQYPKMPGVLRYTQSVPTVESGISFNWTTSGTRSEFTVRADGRSVHGDSEQFGPRDAFQSSGDGAQQLGGIAMQESLQWRRAELVAGVRDDAVTLSRGHIVTTARTTSIATRTDGAASPRLALRYDLTPQLSVRASEGSGFRAPFLNELVRSFQIGSVAYLPNPLLAPERSSSLSGGFDWNSGRTHVALDGFHTSVNDAISFRTIDALTEIRSNFAHTQTDGETMTITRALSTISRLQVFGTAQNARVTSGPSTGKRLPYVPAVSAGADFDTTSGHIDAGISLSYLGQTYADDVNTEPLGTSVLVGAHISVPVRNDIKITVDVENATGAHYLSSIDRYGPPSTVIVGITVPIVESR